MNLVCFTFQHYKISPEISCISYSSNELVSFRNSLQNSFGGRNNFTNSRSILSLLDILWIEPVARYPVIVFERYRRSRYFLPFGTCSTFPPLSIPLPVLLPCLPRSLFFFFFFLLAAKQPSGRSSFVPGVESLMAKLVVIRARGLKRPARTPLELGRARLNFHPVEVRRLVFFCPG